MPPATSPDLERDAEPAAEAQNDEARRGPSRAVLAVAALVAIVVVALVAYSFGRLSTLAPGAEAPGDTSAEAGFARDMQTHHLQGAELSAIVRDRTDDPEVRTLAYDILTTQTQQAGQLYGWLSEWGLGQAGSEPSMTWMTRPAPGEDAHEHAGGAHEPGAPMPGLATPEQVEELRAATGVEAERIFLTLMIAHHHGAIEMADAYLARGDRPTVAQFATNVVRSQEAEIDLMEGMLAERE